MKPAATFVLRVLAVLVGNAVTQLVLTWLPQALPPVASELGSGLSRQPPPAQAGNGKPQGVAPAPVDRRQIAHGWVPKIQSRIKGQSQRPPNTIGGLEMRVSVQVQPGRRVESGTVSVAQSSGDPDFYDSVVAAVYAASPLPVPEGEASFELSRNFDFRFVW